MKLKSTPQYEARARIAKALAHPSRMLMLDALAQRDLCVCELTELVGADQSTVSKHLAVLRDAGVVEMRRQGAQTVCTLKICCLNKFWECVEAVLRQNLQSQRQAVGR
ncbi:MAG: winged helix-turn-helix transcriptional regulator [Phycisphaerae bacterium]|nr:winged helix-turn-helix transcriptional regulator [Phycisphaerae bacterium]